MLENKGCMGCFEQWRDATIEGKAKGDIGGGMMAS